MEVDPALLYVGGLPFTYDDQDVRKAFEDCGTIVDVHRMLFPDSGKFRGIALVQFEDAEAAEKAKAWDGTEWEGRFLVIKQGRKRKAQDRRAGSGPERPKPKGSTTAYVGNLPYDVTESEVRAVFTHGGCEIAGVRMPPGKGMAFVEFESEGDLEKAMAFNGTSVRGREMVLHYSATTGPSSKKRTQRHPRKVV